MLEYVVVVLRQQVIRWFILQNGTYQEVSPGADGIFRSRIFPGLWLPANYSVQRPAQRVCCSGLILIAAPSSAIPRWDAGRGQASPRRGGALRRCAPTPPKAYGGVALQARPRSLCRLPRSVRSWCTAPGTPVWPGCARPGRPLGRRGASLLPAAVPGPGSPTSAPRPSGPGCWGTRALGEHPWPGERRDRLRASPGPGRVGHGTACPRLRPALVAPGCAPRSPRAAGLPGPRRCQRRTTRSLHPKRKKLAKPLQLVTPMRGNLGVGMQGKALDAGTAGTGARGCLAIPAKPCTHAPHLLARPLAKGQALLHGGPRVRASSGASSYRELCPPQTAEAYTAEGTQRIVGALPCHIVTGYRCR